MSQVGGRFTDGARHSDITIGTQFSDQFTSKIHQHLIVLEQSQLNS